MLSFESPLGVYMWRFAHLSDPHLASDRDGVWNNRFLCTMMPEVMACLRRDLALLRPDFILATGDIASTQTRAAMLEAQEMMDSLGFPYYPMGGNHDFVLEDSRKWFLEAFAKHLPAPQTYYSFCHKNLRFIALDAWWLWQDGTVSKVSEASVAKGLEKTLAGARWVVPPEQLTWLDSELAKQTDVPTAIAVHYPAVPIPQRLHRPAFKNGGCLQNGDLLVEILHRHKQVKAIFSGHVHINFIEDINGIVQVVTGALPEYPVEYRDVQVFDDRMEVYTLGLSDTAFAKQSLIAGKEWTKGDPQDRRKTIQF